MSCAKTRLFNAPGPGALPHVAPQGVPTEKPETVWKKETSGWGAAFKVALAIAAVGAAYKIAQRLK